MDNIQHFGGGSLGHKSNEEDNRVMHSSLEIHHRGEGRRVAGMGGTFEDRMSGSYGVEERHHSGMMYCLEGSTRPDPLPS